MQNQQSKLSSSTRYRYSQHNLSNQLSSYASFKSQYQNLLSVPKIQELKKIYPHGILGKNQNNYVVILDRVGVIKTSQLAKIIDDESFIGYILQRLVYLSESVLKQKEQLIWVIDLSGKIMQLASKKSYGIVQKVVSNAQKYFPGILHKLYFINTPMLFDTIWNKVSQTIDPQTQNKIVHLNDDLQQLIAQVGLQLLPKSLGGSQSDEVLFTSDFLVQKNSNNKQITGRQKQQSDQQREIDLNSLKMALTGLKLGGGHNQHPSVTHTPLNTQADDTK